MKLKEFRALLEQRIEDRAKWCEHVYDENRIECEGEIRAFEMVLRDLENFDKEYLPRHENVEL